ncbi:MAG: 30S ribosomal protein S7 [bacterium]|nr:30S ribosomal protein S7 [bacterium]
MRGSKKIHLHTIEPDSKYKNIYLAKFINKIMLNGKKETAQKLVYDALEEVKKRTQLDPIVVFEQAIKNASPQLEVRSKRIGGATYQVPMEVRPDRKNALATHWIIDAARGKQGKPYSIFLADELIDSYNGVGSAMKKKEEMHKMAEANKAFVHFARF